jgi:hypothetical protein
MSWEAEHRARVAEFPQPIREAHWHSSCHRIELLSSELCGCFYCQSIYPPQEITEWADGDQTAFCAKCGVDSVIGAASGLPITAEFLASMHRYWF